MNAAFLVVTGVLIGGSIARKMEQTTGKNNRQMAVHVCVQVESGITSKYSYRTYTLLI